MWLDEDDAKQALYEFEEETWGRELTEAQSHPQKRRKILNSMLHRRVFCKVAAVAILQTEIPMPQTQIDFNSNAPWQEEMNVKLQYAQDMGRWLTMFAQIR